LTTPQIGAIFGQKNVFLSDLYIFHISSPIISLNSGFYKPATVDGRPVSSRKREKVEFVIEE